jgi:hypothetical protein
MTDESIPTLKRIRYEIMVILIYDYSPTLPGLKTLAGL